MEALQTVTTEQQAAVAPAPEGEVELPAEAAQAPGAQTPGDLAPGDLAQFISFRIGEEEYGVDIMAVREIKGWTSVTKLPNTPDFVRGVLNLRGVIVPIFDLRCRFGMGETEATKLHVVIIVAVRDRTIGILVDAVSDILTAGSEQIRPVPEMDRDRQERFLSGLITVEERMVALIALEELFDSGTIAAASGQAGEPALAD